MADAAASPEPDISAASPAAENADSQIIEPPNALVVAISARLTESWRLYCRREFFGSIIDLAIATAVMIGLAVGVHIVWESSGQNPPSLRQLIGSCALLLALLMIAGLLFGSASRDARTYGGKSPFRPLRRLVHWIPERVRSLLTHTARLGDVLAAELALELSAWLLLIAGEGIKLDSVRNRSPGTDDDLRDSLRMLAREGLVEISQTGRLEITLSLSEKGNEFIR